MPLEHTVNNVDTRHALKAFVGSYMKAGCSSRASTEAFIEGSSYAIVSITPLLEALLVALLVRSSSLAIQVDASLGR